MTECKGDYITSANRDDQDTFGKVKLFPSMTYIDPWDVKPEQVFIGDIAHGLAIINRYTGGCPFPSPVGMHCVRMARRVMPSLREASRLTRAELHRRWQRVLAHLLHDASEAMGLNDLASPTKKKPGMEEYVAAHVRALKVIFSCFDVPFEMLADTKPEDDYDFRLEVKSFYEPHMLTSGELVREMAWRDVEREFLSTFKYVQLQIELYREPK